MTLQKALIANEEVSTSLKCIDSVLDRGGVMASFHLVTELK